MNYAPRGKYVWDGWCMPRGAEVHLYHLQRDRHGSPDSGQADSNVKNRPEDCLGHAVSTDLINWKERDPCFGPNHDDPTDNDQPWTGCALWHQDRGHLFYTMRGRENSAVQRIGLAVSEDADRWVRHDANPVITPDERWYANTKRPVPGVVDCRDLVVIADLKGGWLGFYATRQPGAEVAQTSVIACVHSRDLVHWEHRPPAFIATGWACVEVPDVFEIDGTWFMTCLSGNFYGNRGSWSDANVSNGTMYAVAERPEGPYRELRDNVLLGAHWPGSLSCRSVVLNDERFLLYTDRERRGRSDNGELAFGTISTPKLVQTRGDRLVAAYCDRIESRVEAELFGQAKAPAIVPEYEDGNRQWGQIWSVPGQLWQRTNSGFTGDLHSGWSVLPLACDAESFIFEAKVTLESGVAAGLAMRLQGHNAGAVVALDAAEGTVGYYEAPLFDWFEKRNTAISRGVPIYLRIVNRLEHVEIYLDDELRLAFGRYRGIGGHVGLFVDRGTAQFTDLRLRSLRVTEPG